MNKLLMFLIIGTICTCTSGQTVADIEGNVYDTVIIGTQVWMKENLKATRYNDNTPIPNVTDSVAWSNLTTDAFCDWGNDPDNSSIYGTLYNWYVVEGPKEICPSGWHVPSDSEWSVLVAYLGGDSVAGSHLKETGNEHWLFQNTDADNSSGFTALPSGHRHRIGSFATLGYYGFWWSSTKTDSMQAFNRYVSYNNSAMGRSRSEYQNGFSIRCIRDLPSEIESGPHLKHHFPEIRIDRRRRNVFLFDSGIQGCTISIYNCLGQIMYKKLLKQGRDEADVRFLPGGSYILCVSHPLGNIQRIFVSY